MKKVLLLAVFLALSGNAAAQLCEDFPDPLGGWRDRWLAQWTNMTNYYVCTGNPDENFRGNNPCGLWICDTDADFQTAAITIDPAIEVTYWAIGIMVFVPATYTVYDLHESVVFTIDIAPNGTFPPCPDSQIECSIPAGMSRFVIAPNGGDQIEGNTSVDNICAIGIDPVPVEQTTWGHIKASYR